MQIGLCCGTAKSWLRVPPAREEMILQQTHSLTPHPRDGNVGKLPEKQESDYWPGLAVFVVC